MRKTPVRAHTASRSACVAPLSRASQVPCLSSDWHSPVPEACYPTETASLMHLIVCMQYASLAYIVESSQCACAHMIGSSKFWISQGHV